MEFWVSPHKTHDFIFEDAPNPWLVYLLQDLITNNGQLFINTIRNYIWKANNVAKAGCYMFYKHLIESSQ